MRIIHNQFYIAPCWLCPTRDMICTLKWHLMPHSKGNLTQSGYDENNLEAISTAAGTLGTAARHRWHTRLGEVIQTLAREALPVGDSSASFRLHKPQMSFKSRFVPSVIISSYLPLPRLDLMSNSVRQKSKAGGLSLLILGMRHWFKGSKRWNTAGSLHWFFFCEAQNKERLRLLFQSKPPTERVHSQLPTPKSISSSPGRRIQATVAKSTVPRTHQIRQSPSKIKKGASLLMQFFLVLQPFWAAEHSCRCGIWILYVHPITGWDPRSPSIHPTWPLSAYSWTCYMYLFYPPILGCKGCYMLGALLILLYPIATGFGRWNQPTPGFFQHWLSHRLNRTQLGGHGTAIRDDREVTQTEPQPSSEDVSTSPGDKEMEHRLKWIAWKNVTCNKRLGMKLQSCIDTVTISSEWHTPKIFCKHRSHMYVCVCKPL